MCGAQSRFDSGTWESQGWERFSRQCTVAASIQKKSSTMDHFSCSSWAANLVMVCITSIIHLCLWRARATDVPSASLSSHVEGNAAWQVQGGGRE